MKKLLTVLAVFIFSVGGLFAKPVSIKTAQKVAENFYKLNSSTDVKTISLVYTSASGKSAVLFYAFNINNGDGFVIVSGDDAATPVIGYATEKTFVNPEAGSTIGNWLLKRGEEINFIQEKNLVADAKTSQQWSTYLNYNYSNRLINNSTTSSVVSPLVKTTWNQSPNYNAMCPGSSVTGCVATAMAQIMRYWNYPATGNGTSSYNSNFGPLTCNYGAATYNWANMPLSISTSNSDVALINYHCGVSVEMDYSPSGSGAWVCSFDNPVCAQNSYVNYFRYDPSTIQGLDRSAYTDADWTLLLKADLDLGRPIQYVGWDPNAGGHTWVCDGYDANDFFHMNWGWGGSSNGYFSINSMNPSYNFSNGHQAVTGIIPIPSVALDAGVANVSSPVGFYCGSTTFNPNLTIQNYGANTLTSCTINYQIDGGAVQTMPWTGSLVFGQNAVINLPSFAGTSGYHTIICSTTNPNSSADANAANDQSSTSFHLTFPTVLPIVESFETGTLPSSDWYVGNSAGGNNWAVTSSSSATGVKSAMIDNSTNTAGSTSTLESVYSYDVASYASPALTFKMAYQQKTTGNTDKMQVYVSTDCGSSWFSKWARIGSGLATVSGTSSSFVPTSSQFTTYTVNINGIAASHKVMFRWKFYAGAAGPGNNIYLDDINVFDAATTTGIQNTTVSGAALNVYPNPSNGIVNIDLNLTEKHTVAVNVTDMLGRTIENIAAKNYTAGENTLIIGEKNYQSGFYLVNINIDGQIITKKVMIN
jgi:hypothetical protein